MAAAKKKEAVSKKNAVLLASTEAPDLAPAGDSGLRTYRALSDCRVGHLRREGEVFTWDPFAECPDYLEEVDGDDEQDDARHENDGDAAQGATLEDLGLGPAQPAEEVTSGDVIKP